MSQKESAISFLKMVVENDVRGAYEKYIAPDFIHHNQYFKGDRQALMEAMETSNRMHPNKKFEVKRAFEDGNFVVTHAHLKKTPDDLGAAVVHIFRFENGRVAELWDLGQPFAKDSPNENGPF